MDYVQLILELKQGRFVYSTNENGLSEVSGTKPPTSLQLRAARAIEILVANITNISNTVNTQQQTIDALLNENEKLRSLQKCSPNA